MEHIVDCQRYMHQRDKRSYEWILEPDRHDLTSAADEKAWMADHYDAVHDLCVKAERLLTEGYSAPLEIIEELADYGIRYCPGMSHCLDTQRVILSANDVVSADVMLDLHRNHTLRAQGRLGDDQWLGTITHAAWQFMCHLEDAPLDFSSDMVMRLTGTATTSMIIMKGSDEGWWGKAVDHPQGARVRLVNYQTSDERIRYVSKVPGRAHLTFHGTGKVSESALAGLRNRPVSDLVDDPILNGTNLIVTDILQRNDNSFSAAIDDQQQRWHPIIFRTCQILEGVKKVALREYRQATA